MDLRRSDTLELPGFHKGSELTWADVEHPHHLVVAERRQFIEAFELPLSVERLAWHGNLVGLNVMLTAYDAGTALFQFMKSVTQTFWLVKIFRTTVSETC